MIMTVLVPFFMCFVSGVFYLHKFRSNPEKSVRLLVQYKLFFQRWRPECWYWGLVFTCRQILLSCTLLIARDAWEQVCFLVGVLMCYSIVLVAVSPWRLFELNIFEASLISILVFVLIASTPTLTAELMVNLRILQTDESGTIIRENDNPVVADFLHIQNIFNDVVIAATVIFFGIMVVYSVRIFVAMLKAKNAKAIFHGFPASVELDVL